jgi:hypothetical protein
MICPHCSKPMTADSAKMFVCAPCREMIIVLKIVSTFKPPIPDSARRDSR